MQPAVPADPAAIARLLPAPVPAPAPGVEATHAIAVDASAASTAEARRPGEAFAAVLAEALGRVSGAADGSGLAPPADNACNADSPCPPARALPATQKATPREMPPLPAIGTGTGPLVDAASAAQGKGEPGALAEESAIGEERTKAASGFADSPAAAGSPDAVTQALAAMAAVFEPPPARTATPPAGSEPAIPGVTPRPVPGNAPGPAVRAARAPAATGGDTPAGAPEALVRGTRLDEGPAAETAQAGLPVRQAHGGEDTPTAGPVVLSNDAAAIPDPVAAQPLHAPRPSAARLEPATKAVQMTVPGALGSAAWREDFAAGVQMLAARQVSLAELRVQPAELGPVHVSIRIEAGEANVTCGAQHPDTRHALEAALPRLRELLESSGISVGSASVGPEFTGGGRDDRPAQSKAPDAGHLATAAEPLPDRLARAVAHSDKLVDIFA